MGLILLEAFLALVILVGIVWWTMFSGRSKGELRQAQPPSEQPPKEVGQRAPDQAPSDVASPAKPDQTRR